MPAGQVIVGATFEAGAVPTATLVPGDVVTVIVVAPTTAGAAPADGREPAAEAVGAATVWAVTGTAVSETATSESVWLSLLVDESLQTTIAQAASEGRLRLSLTGS